MEDKLQTDSCINFEPTLYNFRSAEEWGHIERSFAQRWNYSNCLGCIDGKHVHMVKPANSGSVYFNYKKTFSISLLAIVGPQYRFLAYEIGRPGRMSDSGIWCRSPLRRYFEPSSVYNPLLIPKSQRLVDHNGVIDDGGPDIPFHLIGDDGFGLNPRLIKPYSRNLDAKKTIFNYRLSRARQVVEVAFGILANRFRVLHNRVHAKVENATLAVETCVLLHNFISSRRPMIHQQEVDKAKRHYSLIESIPELSRPRGDQYALTNAVTIRDYMRDYFLDVYPIPSQYESRAL